MTRPEASDRLALALEAADAILATDWIPLWPNPHRIPRRPAELAHALFDSDLTTPALSTIARTAHEERAA